MKNKEIVLEFSGDFASFDCPHCFHGTLVVTKDEIFDFYFCAYCGLKFKVKNKLNESEK